MASKKKTVLVATALAVFLACAVALLSRTRVPAFDDRDLRLVRSKLGDTENAFFYLDQAATNFYWPESKEKEIAKIAEEEDWNTALESELLSENQKMLALLDKAVNCPGFEVPPLKGFAEDYPYLNDWRHISRVASIQAASLFRQGKQKEAFDLSMKIVQLGQIMEDSGGPILHYLVGSAVKADGLKRLRQMCAKTALRPDQLISYARRLDVHKANHTGLTNAVKAEYQVSVKGLEEIGSGKTLGTNSTLAPFALSLGMKPIFNLTKTKMLLSRPSRTCLESIPQPFNRMPLLKLSPSPTNTSVLRMFLKGNAVGEILVGLLLPSWERVLSRKCQENVAASATQLVLALKAYHSEHGALPESLDELVPHYIASVPPDDFDGKRLRYSKEKKLIWSVGSDLIDSGGQEFDQNKQKLDLPFRIEF